MCGIIAAIADNNIVNGLVNSLAKLEYRGYDSAGIAVSNGNEILSSKAVGKLANLQQELDKKPIIGNIGIGHTRWATHGVPHINNTHPFITDEIALVHNGIVENHEELRSNLQSKGYEFAGNTDSEVISNLITDYIKQGSTVQQAIELSAAQMQGNYAFVVLPKSGDKLYGYKNAAPLAIGLGQGNMSLGSDALALSDLTNEVIYLEDGDLAIISKNNYEIYTQGRLVKRDSKIIDTIAENTKADYDSYMLKEIYEQPKVLRDTYDAYVKNGDVNFDINIDWKKVSKINIIACGTSYHAGLIAKHIIERQAHISVEVDIASEYRYREPIINSSDVSIFISQSGETADTLAALKYAKSKDSKIIALVNVLESAIANLADNVIHTKAGNEVGVASTKAFTVQIMTLTLLAMDIAQKRLAKDIALAINDLEQIPLLVKQFLDNNNIQEVADLLKHSDSILYIGRNTMFPVALEGALKIKELSYIYAEGFASGELKHGPIALIDDNMPVVALAPSNILFDKTLSNVQEIIARCGKIVLVSDKEERGMWNNIKMAQCSEVTSAILYTIPLQLLAYYITVKKGLNVDQPRNLAKSVTVE